MNSSPVKFLAITIAVIAAGGIAYFIIQQGGPTGQGIPPSQEGPSAGTVYLMIAYNSNYLYPSPPPPENVEAATSDQLVGVLERHLDLMDNLGIKADYFFTGLAAEKIAEWSPSIIQRLVSSQHGLDYHGANRPPYPKLVDLMGGESWENDVATARTYEENGIHPTTGEYVGGITAFRTVFGRDPVSTGRFFQAPILAVDKELGVKMAVGLQGNTGASRKDAWFIGILNRPTTVPLNVEQLVESATNDQGMDYLQRISEHFDNIDRSGFNLVTLPLHDWDIYRASPSDTEKIWSLYEQTISLALERGFQPVTSADIYALALNGPAPTLTQTQLQQAAENIAQTIDTTGYPPEYVKTGENYFTLAEVFEALTASLASYRQTGVLPTVVTTHDLLGPTSSYTSSIAPTTIPADDVLEAAASVSTALTSQMPSQVDVGSHTVNPAEFLYLLAKEYIAVAGGTPASVDSKAVEPLPASVSANTMANALTKLQFWTYKPAVFTS